jgi:hypothetical protein
MSRYSFTSLSGQDFEELVRDLLQAEWNVRLEAFKTGRDSGIDLRYATAPGSGTIVQCKHYAGSGYRKLLSDLKNSELPKIEKLKAARYVVVTSLGLSPANKDEIAAALAPFVLTPTDILGENDIEGLLSRHPAVERANFKLWLTSTSVLERVMHNAEHCQTDFGVERIRRKLPLFVQSDAFPRAAELLEKTRIAIVSGAPGIGKTTLAEMLLYEHLNRGFEPVVIQSEVAEGKKLFRPKDKQIFYYDDFLGQTFLGDRREYLGRNEDAAIVDFMEMIAGTPHSRFILTTREHILRNALQLSERLTHSSAIDHRCILELGDYSYWQKARILYNHLYFSDLPQAYKAAVLEDQFFLSIIKHKHFNPRLIEWLSSQTRLKGVAPGAYRAHVSGLLDSPHRIWAHAFENQISPAARHTLLCLYSLGDWSEIRDIEAAFAVYHRHCADKYKQPIAAGDFRKALEELEGGFLSYSQRHQASFLNPSIREFVASVVASSREIAQDILATPVRFKQVANLVQLAKARDGSDLSILLSSNQAAVVEAAKRLLHTPDMRWEKRGGATFGTAIDMGQEYKIGFLAEAAADYQSQDLAVLASEAASALIKKGGIPDFSAVMHLLEGMSQNSWFLSHGGQSVYDGLKKWMLNELEYARAFEWTELLVFSQKIGGWTQEDDARLDEAILHYREKGVDDERYDCTTLDELSGLKESLEELEKKYGFDFKSSISSIDDDIAEREERSYDDDDDRPRSYSSSKAKLDTTTDDDVAQMFDTLR